jgi:murein DD-endopeptidase MepM/ murein hydrolase activator NlpD
MSARVVAAVLVAGLLVTASAAGDPGTDKARVDAELGQARTNAEEAGRAAGVLTSELAQISSQVREVESRIASEQAQLASLESELVARRTTLATLARRIEEQTARLEVLGEQHSLAVGILERRVRELYMTDGPDLLSFLAGTTSFTDVLDNLELLQRIGRQDERIVERVREAQDRLGAVRADTRRDRAAAAEAERVVAARAVEQRRVRDAVVAGRDDLLAAQRDKTAALASVRVNKQDYLAEAEQLEGQSAALAQKLAAAQAAQAAQVAQAGQTQAGQPENGQPSAPSASPAAPPPPVQTPSASGFIWPVDGTFVSGFGTRWGRFHYGVDITAPFGRPVVAVASGTVTETGWHGGFGNLVVIDHGGGLETYYAHNSSFAVSAGTRVSQGQVIAYVGSTGNSSGPHVHLEVHVNGTPVDPMGYL